MVSASPKTIKPIRPPVDRRVQLPVRSDVLPSQGPLPESKPVEDSPRALTARGEAKKAIEEIQEEARKAVETIRTAKSLDVLENLPERGMKREQPKPENDFSSEATEEVKQTKDGLLVLGSPSEEEDQELFGVE